MTMSRWFLWSTLWVAWLGVGVELVQAQPNPVDFVKAVRAKYGPRLAEEYFLRPEFSDTTKLPPALLIEMANVNLDLAAIETDLPARVKYYTKVDKLVDDFLVKFAQDESASEAKLLKVKVLQLKAKALLQAGLRQDAPEARVEALNKARLDLEKVGAQLEANAKEIGSKLTGFKGTDQARRILENTRLQAEFDIALNVADQASCVVGRRIAEDEKRNQLYKKAEGLFEKIATVDGNNPTCWLAYAWLARCNYERGENKKSREKIFEVLAQRGAAAEAGRRQAGYFRLMFLFHVMQGKQPPANDEEKAATTLIRSLGDGWLANYPSYANTPEGLAIRYFIAESYLKQALTEKVAKTKETLFANAAKYYQPVESGDSEYAPAAKQRRIDIKIGLAGGIEKFEGIAVDKLTTFEDLYLRAQFEASQITPSLTPEKRKERLGRMLEALAKGVELADKAPANAKPADLEIENAAALLVYTYLTNNMLLEAIKKGEEIVKRGGTAARSAMRGNTALYTLQAYRQVLNKPDAVGIGTKEEVEKTRKDMEVLADLMITNWREDNPGLFARHQKGVLLSEMQKLPECIATLEDFVKKYPNYSQIVMAYYQLGLAGLTAEERKVPLPDGEQRTWTSRARAAFTNMPELTPGADPTTAEAWIRSKLQLGRLLFLAKDFAELEKQAKPLAELFLTGNIELPAPVRADLQTPGLALWIYGVYGKAEKEYSEAKYANVLTLLTPIFAELQKDAYKSVLLKDPRIRQAVLDSYQRASLFEGKTALAYEVLKFKLSLELELAPEGKLADGGAALVYEPVLVFLIAQTQDLRRKDKNAEADKLANHMLAFLNEIAKEKTQTVEVRRLLAQSYFVVEKPDLTLALLKDLPKPADKPAEGDRAQLLLQDSHLLRLKCLRLTKKLDEHEKLLKELQEAEWGKKHIEVIKEAAHLLFLRDKFGEASTAFLRVSTAAGRFTTPKGNELYLESYFHMIEAYYHYAKTLKDEDRDKIVKKCADLIVKIEPRFGELGGGVTKRKYLELFQKELPLREAYDALKPAKPEPKKDEPKK